MSSICGLLYRDGRKVDPVGLARMVEVSSHWKPDTTGTWHEGSVGFGHLALWTTPESVAERCPFRDSESGVVVTADARIDNRDELIHELGISDRSHDEIGDVELIARAYLKWGRECPIHLIGDFAFALWDPAARRLFCARDAMGVRPFFYYLDEGRFIFGSEIKAIFSHPNVPREINPRHLALRLSGIPTFDDITQFKSIQLIEPATALCVEVSGISKWKYWRLEIEHEIHFARDEDYVHAFEELLRKALDARLRSTSRVGAMLSGGLDATTLLAYAIQGGKIPFDRLSAFSWALREGDDWWEPDERKYIDIFLREHPLDHCYVIPESEQLFDIPSALRRHRDGPVWEVDHCQMRPTFAGAQARGIRVLLSGTGGDETASFAAPDYLLSRILRCDWTALQAEVDARANAQRAPKWQIWKSHIIRPLLRWQRLLTPFQYQWLHHRRCERIRDLSLLGIPLTKECLAATDLIDYVREGSRPRLDRPWRSPLRAQQIYELTQIHVQSDLIGSWNYSASYGVECRCPYLDRRLIEYCVAMPPNQHYYANSSRRLLRRAAERCLPAKIAQRRNKSSTMPDLARGICQVESSMKDRLQAWRSDPRVTFYLDIAAMESNLEQIVEKTKARSSDWVPALPFCRGVLLGTFIEAEPQLT